MPSIFSVDYEEEEEEEDYYCDEIDDSDSNDDEEINNVCYDCDIRNAGDEKYVQYDDFGEGKLNKLDMFHS